MTPKLNHPLDVFLYDVLSFLGKWYSWGGDDPEGFDCSGLVVEGLKAAGVIARGSDFTADALWRLFPSCPRPLPGCLVFFGRSDRATHVEVVVGVDEEFGVVWTVGASGGNSKTTTKEQAMKDNAFVKLRPITRSDFLNYADPFHSRRNN